MNISLGNEKSVVGSPVSMFVIKKAYLISTDETNLVYCEQVGK